MINQLAEKNAANVRQNQMKLSPSCVSPFCWHLLALLLSSSQITSFSFFYCDAAQACLIMPNV